MNINQSSNNVNFTSVIPLKVLVGKAERVCYDLNMVENAASKVVKSLKGPANGDSNIIKLKKEFIEHDKDFSCKSNIEIRKVVHNGRMYLFTNKHAEILNELGKKIGFATDTAKAAAQRAYFDKISELLENINFRIKETINPKTHAYEGEPIELNIHVKEQGNIFEKVSFSKMV